MSGKVKLLCIDEMRRRTIKGAVSKQTRPQFLKARLIVHYPLNEVLNNTITACEQSVCGTRSHPELVPQRAYSQAMVSKPIAFFSV